MRKNNESKAHATFSASSSERWLQCPGSIKLSRGMPNYETTYAREGTEAHKCFEILLSSADIITAAKNLKRSYPPEMVDHALTSVDEFLELYNQFSESKLFIENKIDSSRFTCPGQFGTLDAAVANYKSRHLVICDFKYGAGIAVEVEHNTQLIYYALGMLNRLGWSKFDSVELVVIQPRAEHHSGKTTRSIIYQAKELIPYGVRFKAGVKKALGENPPLKSGGHCKFCPAKIKCPELRDKSFQDAVIDFTPMEKKLVTVPRIEKVENIGRLLQACEKLEIFISAVRERAYNDLKSNKKVDGYKLVEKRSTRKWINEERFKLYINRWLGDEGYRPQEILSPAQFEKKFKKEKEIMNVFEKNITNKPGGVTIARAADKRKSINIFEATFGVLDDDTF